MLQGSPKEWLSNLYDHYKSSSNFRKITLSPDFRRQSSIIQDLGLVLYNGRLNKIKTANYSNKASIKLGELLGAKHTNSVINKAGLVDAAKKIKYNHNDCLKKLYSQESPFIIKKSTSILIKSATALEWQHAVTSCTNSPKSKVAEINPLFYTRLSEISQKSKKMHESAKKFSKRILVLKKKSDPGKLKKTEKEMIEKNLKLM